MRLFSSSGFSSPSPADRKRERAARRAEVKKIKRRRRIDERKLKRQRAADIKRRKRAEERLLKIERQQRRADEKRRRADQKRWKREQKKNAWSMGGFGRSRGRSAAGMRAAHNLLSLADSIGVRFGEADRKELLEYADSQLAGSGEDIYTVYNRLIRLSYIGRRVRGVIGQYEIDDYAVAEGDTQGATDKVLSRITAAAELLGRISRTGSVETAIVESDAIVKVLGTTPEDIKRDQQMVEKELTAETYDAMLQESASKGFLWRLFNRDRNPANAGDVALSELDERTRAADAVEAEREREAVAAEVRAAPSQSYWARVWSGLWK